MIGRLMLITALLYLTSPVFTDEILFQTDFNQLPEDWYAADRWEFTSNGALLYRNHNPYLDALLMSGLGPSEMLYFIPDGIDSVIVKIPYYLNAYACEEWIVCSIELGCTGHGWEEIWSRHIGYIENIDETDTLAVSPAWLNGGCWMGIRFDSYASPMENSAVKWLVNGITITAVGDELDMTTSTWAAIKSFSL